MMGKTKEEEGVPSEILDASAKRRKCLIKESFVDVKEKKNKVIHTIIRKWGIRSYAGQRNGGL